MLCILSGSLLGGISSSRCRVCWGVGVLWFACVCVCCMYVYIYMYVWGHRVLYSKILAAFEGLRVYWSMAQVGILQYLSLLGKWHEYFAGRLRVHSGRIQPVSIELCYVFVWCFVLLDCFLLCDFLAKVFLHPCEDRFPSQSCALLDGVGWPREAIWIMEAEPCQSKF